MTVECYAGYRYPERPRAFLWEGERLDVAEIERQWRTLAGPVFRVRVSDGRRFTLAYDEATSATADAAPGDWSIQPALERSP